MFTQFITLCKDALLQARRSKVLTVLIVLCSLVLIYLFFGIQTETGGIVEDEMRLSVPLFNVNTPVDPVKFANSTMRVTMRIILTVGVFFFIFAFSGFIPQSLAKGSADLLLSKPIYRWMILLAKSLVIAVVSFFTAAYLYFGVMLIVWFKSGFLTDDFILPFFGVLLLFIPLLATMTLLNVLTRSTVITVIVTLFLYFVASMVGGINMGPGFDDDPAWLFGTLKVLHYCLPDFVAMSASVVGTTRGEVLEFDPFGHALIYSAVVFIISTVILNRKNYTV
ncbi:MAG: ABC transporter permease subunit [Planctomycetota bacterium]|nr:ABC transporter permease subunit [Planctomycetota bacterium]